jgi:hypothetical protein
MEASPNVPTAFETQVRKLGLNEQNCATSEELRQWCKSNKDRCYIPDWLLKRWEISVDPNLGPLSKRIDLNENLSQFGMVQIFANCYDFLRFVTGYHWAALWIFSQLSQTGNCSPGLSNISDTVTS